MHILIMFHSNNCQFILTTSLITTQQKPLNYMHYPLIYQSTRFGLYVLSKIKGTAKTSPVKCVYTGPIGELTNINTSQNTKHKKDLMLIYCVQEKQIGNANFIWINIVLCSQLNLMIYPTLSSIISFHSNLKIRYVDMTSPHKQEQEHRLSHSHTIHSTCMWISHLIVEIQNCLSSMWKQGPLYFLHTTYLYSSSHDSHTDRNCFPDILLKTPSAQNNTLCE